MSNTWINIITVILLVAAAAIPYSGDIVKDIPPNRKKATWRYYSLLLIAMATFLFGLWKERNNEIEQSKLKYISDSTFNAKQFSRDSLNQVRNDSSIASVIRAYTNGLNEYNLNVERNLQGVVKVVRDSAKRVVNQNYDPDPYFGICTDPTISKDRRLSITKNTNGLYTIDYQFCADNSTSAYVNMKSVILYKTQLGYKSFTPYPIAPQNHMFSPGETFRLSHKGLSFDGAVDSTVFIYIFGTYKNVNGNKRFIGNYLQGIGYGTKLHESISYTQNMEIRLFLYNQFSEVRQFYSDNNLGVLQ